jgi:hypothetical protein
MCFTEGFQHAKLGKSIHYNPYRNDSFTTVEKYKEWERGWKMFHKEKTKKNTDK